jgi:hypothetical protein
VAPTHSRRALVSVNYHYYQQLLSGDHLHHGLLGPLRDRPRSWAIGMGISSLQDICDS